MPNASTPELVVTGVGITTAVGQGAAQVERALADGEHAFRIMGRDGRQKNGSAFIGAEIGALQMPEHINAKAVRGISWSSQVALATMSEAWTDARLHELDPQRVGLVVGGSNLQQRELTLLHDSYRERFDFLRPTYGQLFMDTDIAAVCSEQFGVRGMVCTAGGASASGHLAVVQAAQMVHSGSVDACVALGALTDLSYWECQGLRALGAMGSDKFAQSPAQACRPFDRDHDGFIFGESCAALVVERAGARGNARARLAGWSFVADAHRGPDPSVEGETRAISVALAASSLAPGDIDYVNPHGTGSRIGDATELDALRACGLEGARINATKSILGHGLAAAGVVELAVTLLQMRAGRLHPTRNLDAPIDPSFLWVSQRAEAHDIRNALNLSFGFGGMNSAICLSRC